MWNRLVFLKCEYYTAYSCLQGPHIRGSSWCCTICHHVMVIHFLTKFNSESFNAKTFFWCHLMQHQGITISFSMSVFFPSWGLLRFFLHAYCTLRLISKLKAKNKGNWVWKCFSQITVFASEKLNKPCCCPARSGGFFFICTGLLK